MLRFVADFLASQSPSPTVSETLIGSATFQFSLPFVTVFFGLFQDIGLPPQNTLLSIWCSRCEIAKPANILSLTIRSTFQALPMVDDSSAERFWYTGDESLVVTDDSRRRFPKFRSAQNPQTLNLTASARLQRQFDSDKWESQRLSYSGVTPSHFFQSRDEEENENRVCLQVNSTPPPFLSNLDSSKFHIP
jgi:hypothetical protein